MSIKSEKQDEKNRKTYETVHAACSILLIIDLCVLFVGLCTLNTDLVVWCFFIALFLAAPVGWMGLGGTKDLESGSTPWWWGGL